MKKILVVEDEYYARKSIVKILQESDLDIQVCGEAENGMKAIELLEEYKDIALVITDIQMQKMGGLELASYLHKHIPEIDVLILTAFENFDYAREALRYNVKDYIVKPIYKENLLPPVKKVLEKQEEKSRNQEKIKNYYQWEAAKNYFPVKTIVAHEELYKEFFSYNAIHQEEKFCIVVMQEEELVTDVELVNRIIQEKYRGFIKDFFFSKINEEYVMLLSGIECMDNELIVQEKVESMLSYFCTCKHMNITMGVGLVYSSKEKIYQSYNEALYALNQRLIQGWNRAYFYKNMDGYKARIGKEAEIKLESIVRTRKEKEINQVIHSILEDIYQLEGQNGVNITENEEFISISKGKIEARVRKYPWEVSYYLDGKLKTKEQIKDSNVDNMCKNLPVGFTYDENKEIIGVNETMYLYADEEFYGFGEKFTDFGKRGQTINCWQTDALSTNTEKSYKNHPFFMSSRGYAILLNTYTRSKFEMGSFSNVAYNMSVEDKVLDYVIWMGNDYKALLKSYINQTGKIPMIPKWALGLWMSKCSYQTQDEIYEVVKISKERDIKIDVIHIDGWQKEGDAGAWVWDYERFPNPEEMIYKLKKEGIHLCLWIFPYIDENSKYFKEAEEKGFLVKNTKGVTSRFYSTATSTSKVGCFDFTNPHFIEWYKPKVRSVVSMGIGAVKTDFSEAVPEDAVYFDGSTGIQGHNKLTFLYAKTIYDIMAEVKIPLGELPMLWGRSGYAGSHTIPAAWAGDSSTHLNNHACILRGGLSASMSGIPFWGFDMGGFYNTDHEGYECVPTDEEYIRSCQFGFFNSLSRCHGKTPREPWNFGEKAEKIFKKFNDIRHLLLPYLYSTTYKTHLSDIPVIRPVVMEYPEDRSARNVELEYFLGDSLLVVPVFDQEDEIDVYLPNGQWIDLFTHERIKGGRWVKRKIELDKIPVFIRQNKMIPMLTKIPENIEEKYENLDVILFCEDEIRDTYIDDGNVQNLKAKIEEGTLFINTDMDASYFTVYAEKCLDNAVVNGQNWEIKKEKEGYYKIALEK